jgi:hypothetical protein
MERITTPRGTTVSFDRVGSGLEGSMFRPNFRTPDKRNSLLGEGNNILDPRTARSGWILPPSD